MAILLDAESAEQCGGVALGVPSLEFGKFLLELGGAYAVGVGEVGLRIEGVFLTHNVPEHGVPLEHGVHDGAVVELEVVLLKHAHALAGTLCDGAVC